MPATNDPLYFGREQTLIKHKILEKYLERFALIVGRFSDAITYVDGFSGPWNPERDATYFHLVYATRDLKGLEVFKDSERKALEVAGELRADAKRRKRERNTGQAELFAGETLPDTNHTDYLHQHYQRLAKKNVLDLLHAKLQVPYDELFSIALRYPLVTQNDLRSWISEVAEVQGLGPREKPKPRQGLLIQMRENMGQLL